MHKRHNAIRIGLFGVAVAAIAALGIISFASRSALANDTVTLLNAGTVEYAGHITAKVQTDCGIAAYSIDPSLDLPEDGNYKRAALSEAFDTSRETYLENEVAYALYCSYGAPGFDASLWPSAWYDKTPMTPERYYVLCSALVCDLVQQSSNSALAGCDEAFVTWCNENVLGYDTTRQPINADTATRWLVVASCNNVPERFVSSCYAVTTGAASQTFISYDATGGINLQLSSTLADVTTANQLYSTDDETYAICRDENCSDVVEEITFEGGYACCDVLEPGEYFIKQTHSAAAFEADGSIYCVEVEGAATYRRSACLIEHTPKTTSPDILVRIDPQRQTSLAQGDASFVGATYTVMYFDSYIKTIDEAENTRPTRTWVVATDEYGSIRMDYEHLNAGEDFFLNAENNSVLPLGTLLICEAKASRGYTASSEKTLLNITLDANEQITIEGDFEDGRVAVAAGAVIRGGLEIRQQSSSSSSLVAKPGAQFCIRNISDSSVYVAGSWYAPGADIMTVTAEVWDSNGDGALSLDGSDICIATTDTDHDGYDETLPYGTYEIRMTQPGEGGETTNERTVLSIRSPQGSIVCADDTTSAQ